MANPADHVRVCMEHIHDPMQQRIYDCEKNDEVWEEDCGQGDRAFFKIGTCILHAECRHQVFLKYKVWSIDCPERCLVYMKHHLVNSGKHLSITCDAEAQMVIDDAFAEANGLSIDWQCYVETKASRDDYFAQVAKNQQLHADAPPPPPPPKKFKHNDSIVPSITMNAQIQMAVDTAVGTAMTTAMLNQGSGSSGSTDLELTMLGTAQQAEHMLSSGNYYVPKAVIDAAIGALKRVEKSLMDSVTLHVEQAQAQAEERQTITSLRVNLQQVKELAKGKGKGKKRNDV